MSIQLTVNKPVSTTTQGLGSLIVNNYSTP